ncbi:protein kinase domain-containing protein [Sorangium sp. So ce124]|uniref:serine/threonine-protein kinase n=1 Tax=Sorangium sp. So ce124 TaxID=3133280 RepID=UPI003F5E294D
MEALICPGALLLGKYRVEGVLGKGGMGVVVAARHVDLDELRAIKLLLPQTLRDAHAKERFLREARAAVRVRGEHAVRVHDIGELPTGELFMVLELLSGANLKQIVQARGPLPVEEAATYVIQASKALAEAHALGIVHRDIKPANLFLTQRPDGSPCVKVLDFGISKQIASDDMELTATGALLGSPLYMSPEQMVRTKEVDGRSDIWAMGVSLYELVTGTLPFRADTLPELVGRVLQEDAAPPSRLRPGLPAELDAIIARCLQKRPEHRYQRIEELSSALDALRGGAQRGLVSRPGVAPQPALVPPAAARPSSPPHTSNPASPPLTVPASAPLALVRTSSAWGHTGVRSGPTARHRARALAGAALGVGALAACISWRALRAAPDSVEAPAAGASTRRPDAPPPGEPPLRSGVAQVVSSPGDGRAVPSSSPPPPVTAAAAPSAAAPTSTRRQGGVSAGRPKPGPAVPGRLTIPTPESPRAPGTANVPLPRKREPLD